MSKVIFKIMFCSNRTMFSRKSFWTLGSWCYNFGALDSSEKVERKGMGTLRQKSQARKCKTLSNVLTTPGYPSMPGGPVLPGLPGSPVSPLSPLRIQQPLNITTVTFRVLHSKLYKLNKNSRFLTKATVKGVRKQEGAEKCFSRTQQLKD